MSEGFETKSADPVENSRRQRKPIEDILRLILLCCPGIEMLIIVIIKQILNQCDTDVLIFASRGKL
jgi:hypothetical protein